MTKEGGDFNDIRSMDDEIDEEDEVFRSYYTKIDQKVVHINDMGELRNLNTVDNASMFYSMEPSGLVQMATKGNLGRLLPHARGLEFKPCRGGFPSGAKKEWGLSPKAKVRVLHTAQLDVTVSSNH
nr:hypothetical protein [Tanacetum cinerariifolium]